MEVTQDPDTESTAQSDSGTSLVEEIASALDSNSEHEAPSPSQENLLTDNKNEEVIESNPEASQSQCSADDSDVGSWEDIGEEDVIGDDAQIEEACGEMEREDEPCNCPSCYAPSKHFTERVKRRQTHLGEPLPENVTQYTSKSGAQVYIVGTAHFSEASQNDVSKTIEVLNPDVVMVELCQSRMGVLKYDEESLLKEAQDVSLAKLRMAIQESGVLSGVMQLLLLSMSAHVTKQLGMAPGGEFRRAAKEAKKVPGCCLILGDRPIQVTLGRAMGSLSMWQKTKLAWHLIFSRDDISKEDVEKYKQKDMIAEMLAEMTGDYPELSRVFVDERDKYMAALLQQCIYMIEDERRRQPHCTLDPPKEGETQGDTAPEDFPEGDIQGKESSRKDEGSIAEGSPSDQHDIPRERNDDTAEDSDEGMGESMVEVVHPPLVRPPVEPVVIVGVVGIGHMSGIIENMDKQHHMEELMKMPPPSKSGYALKMSLRASLVALASWGVYKITAWTGVVDFFRTYVTLPSIWG